MEAVESRTPCTQALGTTPLSIIRIPLLSRRISSWSRPWSSTSPPPATENALLEELADRDPELAASLKEKLFTIDVIFRIPDQELEARIEAVNPDESVINVCEGTGCIALGSTELCAALEQQIREKKLEKRVRLRRTGCHGFCEKGPVVVIQPEKIFYAGLRAEDVGEILDKTILGGELIDRLLYVDPQTHQKIPLEREIPFYSLQTRTLLLGNQLVDSTKLEDYLATGGYDAVAKVLKKHFGNGMKKRVRRDITTVQCPDCGGRLEHKEGCVLCPSCGFSKC